MAFLSICIPSYNRPTELIRLLNSIDTNCNEDIEVLICEDKSPKRIEVIEAIEKFKATSILNIRLHENEINLGYDANLASLISLSHGKYILFMGDDDTFIKENLKKYISFLKLNPTLGYVLRRYSVTHKNGVVEDFNYYKKTTFFMPGEDAFISLLRKSVFISGFCFNRSLIQDVYQNSTFNGTLLYQLFICGEIVLNHPSAYCDIPITQMVINERAVPEFGSSENEKGIYTPGEITVSNSVNFMKAYLVILTYFDSKYNFNLKNKFLLDMSKYSYPILSIQRNSGLKSFWKYNTMLKTEIGLNASIYYYVYFWSLLILGSKNCDFIIQNIKKYLGRTPSL